MEIELKTGHAQDVVSENVRELIKAGTEPKQAIAMALLKARESRMAEPEEPISEAPIEAPAERVGLTDAAKAAILAKKQSRTFNN